jgi:hypothetical protein
MGKVDAYTLMASEFKGAPKKIVIQAHIRMALTKYGLKEDRVNLEEFGITLIGLKKKYGISELNILKHACQYFDPEVSFRMQATISAVYLTRQKNKE